MYKMYKKEKQSIIDACNKMIKLGITRATGGNISILTDDGLMLITPANIPYHKMTVDMIVEMDLDGNVISSIKNPSSEWRMHAEAYKVKPNARAMIHAHAIYCMVVSTIYKKLPAIDYLIAFSGSYEVMVTKYKRYGTIDIALESAKYLKNYYAVILANHGINVISENLTRSFAILENLELCAELYCKAKQIGEPKILPKNEINELLQNFSSYGVNNENY